MIWRAHWIAIQRLFLGFAVAGLVFSMAFKPVLGPPWMNFFSYLVAFGLPLWLVTWLGGLVLNYAFSLFGKSFLYDIRLK